MEHDPFRKPVSTFRDHALASRAKHPSVRDCEDARSLEASNSSCSSTITRPITAEPSPRVFCRNSRAVEYQGLSSQSSSHRQSDKNGSNTQTGFANAPARWAMLKRAHFRQASALGVFRVVQGAAITSVGATDGAPHRCGPAPLCRGDMSEIDAATAARPSGPRSCPRVPPRRRPR